MREDIRCRDTELYKFKYYSRTATTDMNTGKKTPGEPGHMNTGKKPRNCYGNGL